MHILKAIVRPQRRCLHAFEARTFRAGAKGFHRGSLAPSLGSSFRQADTSVNEATIACLNGRTRSANWRPTVRASVCSGRESV